MIKVASCWSFVGNLYFLHFHDFKQIISTTQGHCNIMDLCFWIFFEAEYIHFNSYNCATHVDCAREILLMGIKKLWWEFWWDRISGRFLSSNILKIFTFSKNSILSWKLHILISKLPQHKLVLIWILILSLLEDDCLLYTKAGFTFFKKH